MEHRGGWSRLLSLAAAMLLGAALGAVQLLPTYEALTLSYRAELPRVMLGRADNQARRTMAEANWQNAR
jgi:hypothetical protein